MSRRNGAIIGILIRREKLKHRMEWNDKTVVKVYVYKKIVIEKIAQL